MKKIGKAATEKPVALVSTCMKKAKRYLAFVARRIAMAILCAVPTHGFAHEDHGVAQVAADAVVIETEDNRLDLAVQMYNLAPHDVTLFAVKAPGAQPVEALFTTVPAGASADALISLTFDFEIPAIFTAILDFGDDGQGPLLVLP